MRITLLTLFTLIFLLPSCLKRDCTADSKKVLGKYRCKEPHYVVVHKVHLYEITDVDPNGNPWVEEGEPEMYVAIDNYGANSYNGKNNVQSTLPATWDVGNTFIASESIKVQLYHVKDGTGFGMGAFKQVDFGDYRFAEPNENGLRYPDILPVQLRYIPITLYLELEWIYE